MAHRHKMHEKKAKGGGVTPKTDAHKKAYNAQGSNVEHEAEEKKHGGKVHHGHKAHGHKGKHRFDKKARGGSVAAKKAGSGKDMTTSPWSAAHTGSGGNPAENPKAHLPKGVHGAHPKG